MEMNALSGQIVDAGMKVHSALGPGLLESAYQVCLAHELGKRGFTVRREVLVPVHYDGLVLDAAYRIELIDDDAVVVEIKTLATNIPVHEANLLYQIKQGKYRLGLLINFNVVHLKDGIVRKINRL